MYQNCEVNIMGTSSVPRFTYTYTYTYTYSFSSVPRFTYLHLHLLLRLPLYLLHLSSFLSISLLARA